MGFTVPGKSLGNPKNGRADMNKGMAATMNPIHHAPTQRGSPGEKYSL